MARSSDEVALTRAIMAAPDDDLPRLVHADWVEEQGRNDHVITRVQVPASREGRAYTDEDRATLVTAFQSGAYASAIDADLGNLSQIFRHAYYRGLAYEGWTPESGGRRSFFSFQRPPLVFRRGHVDEVSLLSNDDYCAFDILEHTPVKAIDFNCASFESQSHYGTGNFHLHTVIRSAADRKILGLLDYFREHPEELDKPFPDALTNSQKAVLDLCRPFILSSRQKITPANYPYNIRNTDEWNEAREEYERYFRTTLNKLERMSVSILDDTGAQQLSTEPGLQNLRALSIGTFVGNTQGIQDLVNSEVLKNTYIHVRNLRNEADRALIDQHNGREECIANAEYLAQVMGEIHEWNVTLQESGKSLSDLLGPMPEHIPAATLNDFVISHHSTQPLPSLYDMFGGDIMHVATEIEDLEELAAETGVIHTANADQHEQAQTEHAERLRAIRMLNITPGLGWRL